MNEEERSGLRAKFSTLGPWPERLLGLIQPKPSV